MTFPGNLSFREIMQRSLRFELTAILVTVSMLSIFAVVAILYGFGYIAKRPGELEPKVVLAISAAAFTLAFGVAYPLIRGRLAILERLTESTTEIAAGDYSAARSRLQSFASHGELAALSQALQSMSEALRSKEGELKSANLRLEELVAIRTANLERALQDAERAERARDDLLACVSHELRTPLASIRAFAEILFHHADEPKEIRNEFVSIILAEADRLGALVTNMLDYVRFLSGDVDWILDDVDLLAVAREVTHSFAPLLAQHEIRIEIEDSPALKRVRCDRDKIHRALASLVSNAIKFSPHGGTIEIRAQHVGPERQDVRLVVSDQGEGISPEDKTRIFERFHQTDDVLTGKPSGTGLGLPLAKEIVERHGGRIFVESKKGQGARFHMILPAQGPREDQLQRGARLLSKTRTQVAPPA